MDVKRSSTTPAKATKTTKADLPTDLRLDDEVRLEKIKFSEEEKEETPLTPLEQVGGKTFECDDSCLKFKSALVWVMLVVRVMKVSFAH